MVEKNSSVAPTTDFQNLSVQSRLASHQAGKQAVPSTDGSLRIHCERVTKKFGSVIANNDISCDIYTGGIHAFLGENGAGKSTLMKILAGYYQPDFGSLYINNHLVNFRSPTEARQFGIGMVHQQFTLVPSLTVLENVLLGHPATPLILNPKKQAATIGDKAARHGIDLDLYAPISRLNMAQRQKVEILKLLWRDARILILDEPTSQLAPFEAEEILQTMSHLANQGRIVILITHHIEELLKFASVITVLRQGRVIDNFYGSSVQAEELARLMIGELDSRVKRDEEPCPVERANRSIIFSERSIQTVKAQKDSFAVDTTEVSLITVTEHLELQNVHIRKSASHRALHDINLEIKAGEVHGIAAVAGSGQDELVAVLCGHLIPENGKLVLDGRQASWKILSDPSHSCAHVPAEPKKASLAGLTLWENLFLRNIHRKKYLAGPFIKKKEVIKMAEERLNTFDVRPRHKSALGGSLSGGNLQRLILAREFQKQASLMVAVNPTAGLDLAMSLRIREKIKQYVAGGRRSLLLISPDLDELLKTCDRISVMFAGRIVGTEDVSSLNAQSLGLLMGGNSLATVNDRLPMPVAQI